MTVEELMTAAKNAGFTTAAPLDVSTLKALPAVREMCKANTCGRYNACWSCPPGCGELEACEKEMKRFSRGILVQYVGDIEDSMDWEGIMEVQAAYEKIFREFCETVRMEFPEVLPLGAGTCTICKNCSFPDAPCRFPDRRISSMESFGLFVSDVCKNNGVKYNYGQGKMCYTGCYLFR